MPTITMPSTLADWLNIRLDERGLGNNQAATYLGVSHTTMSRWRRGEAVPDPESCAKLAAFFGRPLDEVLAIAGHRPRTPAQLERLSLLAEVDDLLNQFGPAIDRMKEIRDRLARLPED